MQTKNPSGYDTLRALSACSPSPAEEVARAVAVRIRLRGLARLDEVTAEYETMKTLLSGVSWWPEAARLCEAHLASARQEAAAMMADREERERQHQLELERIRANNPNITLIQQPNAKTGIDAGGVNQQNLLFGQQAAASYASTTY